MWGRVYQENLIWETKVVDERRASYDQVWRHESLHESYEESWITEAEKATQECSNTLVDYRHTRFDGILRRCLCWAVYHTFYSINSNYDENRENVAEVETKKRRCQPLEAKYQQANDPLKEQCECESTNSLPCVLFLWGLTRIEQSKEVLLVGPPADEQESTESHHEDHEGSLDFGSVSLEPDTN